MPRHSYSYVQEKLKQGLYSFARSGTIQSRLANAWLAGPYLLDRDAFSDEMELDLFDAINAALSSVSDEQVGSIQASAQAMSDEEAADVAQKFVELANLATLAA